MTSDQIKSLGITLGIHILIAILLMFIFITTPNPPWEDTLAGGGGGGSFVEFGTVEFSEATPVQQKQPDQQVTQPVKSNEEELLTSEAEESVSIEKKESRPVKIPVKTEKPVVIKKPAVVAPALPKVEEKKVNQAAIYKGGAKTNGGSPDGLKDGGGTGGEGTGNYSGKGPGTGPGEGGGDGGGTGGGHGPGNGIGFDLSGRNWRAKPSISDNSQEQGKVVIDIIVDKYGNVVSATGPGRGSTTTSGNLVRKAKESALRAKFSASEKGVEEQRGSITFNFFLR